MTKNNYMQTLFFLNTLGLRPFTVQKSVKHQSNDRIKKEKAEIIVVNSLENRMSF